MGSPVDLIIVSHREDLVLLQDFAGRNAMALVSAEVGGLSGLGYFTQDDLLDTLSLLQHLCVACILYKIALPIVPLPPHASPPSLLSDSSSSLEDASDRVEHSSSVKIQQRPRSHM